MQICDNKSHLGQIFRLDKEVIGFDTVEEAIELCHYFLEHDDERRQIAAAGWERALKDYNEVTVFKLMISYVSQLQHPVRKQNQDVILYLDSRRRHTIMHRSLYHLRNLINSVFRIPQNMSARMRRRWRSKGGEARV